MEEAFGPKAWDVPRRDRRLPFTKDSRHVLELALREAIELKNPRLGAEHILPALLRERGPAWTLLEELGGEPERTRRELRRRLGRLACIAGR